LKGVSSRIVNQPTVRPSPSHRRGDPGGPPCGQEAGRQRDEQQHRCNGDERDRIVRANAVEQALHQPRQRQGARQSHDETRSRQRKSLLQHHANDLRSVGTDGQPDANLVRPLGDQVREHAVQANRGQRQANRAKHTEQKPWANSKRAPQRRRLGRIRIKSVGSRKPSGMTPITSTGTPLSMMRRPTMAGSAPNCASQSP
jgi:hypothetical protein